jgi:nifR3 family TIM-barrel protein
MAPCVRVGPEEHPIALQISGADPSRAAEAARRCEGEGADIIDINMGCPATKVTKGLCGAALLRDAPLAARLAGAVVRAVGVPVTAKMRLGWSARELTYLEVARAIVAEGVAALTLHPRTRDQGYSGEAKWPEIANLKAEVGVPVVGNGDVRRPEQALELWRSTGCEGVMVGRAAVKNPWIFRQIEELKQIGRCSAPTAAERCALILGHFRDLIEDGPPKLALHRMKSFLGKYTSGMPGAASLRGSLEHHRDPHALMEAFGAWAAELPPSPVPGE